MTAASQRHDEQARLAIFSGARVARTRSLAVIDLRFLPWLGFKATLRVRLIRRLDRAHETLDRVVRAFVAVAFDEVLIDRGGIAPFGAFFGDERAIRFAGAPALGTPLRFSLAVL